jgi:hypothetical protein
MSLNFQGVLQTICSVLGFEVGEVWLARKLSGFDCDSFTFNVLIPVKGQTKISLRFHQLYISSIYEENHKSLIQPNVANGISDEESNHKISPTVSIVVIVFSHNH